MPLLEIEDLSRSFGATRALAGASLKIERGEIVALMGANGAGKSTVVKILSGALTPDGGRIRLKDKPFLPQSPMEAAAAGIATVHQSTDLVGAPGLTLADNLLLARFADGRMPFCLSRASVRRAARGVLEEIGLDLPLDRDFASLSPAERQLVAIARALAERPDLLILDEPTASLSQDESDRLFDILKRLRGRGQAILYISHRTADLKAVASRAAVMRGGRVVGDFMAPIDFDAAFEAMIGRRLAAAVKTQAAAGPPVLRLRGIRLLDRSSPFDLMLCEGEVVAVTGVLGAGKSRLLRAIFGDAVPAEGWMELDGRAYRPSSPAAAIAAGVFMAGEDRHRSSLMPPLWPGHSIAATISLPHLGKWYRSGLLFGGRERREAEQAIRRLGIKAQGPLSSVWSLSGGNQQKAVIARWEAEPSRLLLLDEPFQGVDVAARQDIIAAIRSRTGRATLIATSDAEEAEAVADRILVMDRHSLCLPDQPGADRTREDASA